MVNTQKMTEEDWNRLIEVWDKREEELKGSDET